jgi:hypothetical protein
MKKNTAKKIIMVLLSACLLPLSGCFEMKDDAMLEHKLLLQEIVDEANKRAVEDTVLGKAVLEIAAKQEGNTEQITAQEVLNYQTTLKVDAIEKQLKLNTNKIAMLSKQARQGITFFSDYKVRKVILKVGKRKDETSVLRAAHTYATKTTASELKHYYGYRAGGVVIEIPKDEAEAAIKAAEAECSIYKAHVKIREFVNSK